MLTECRTSCDTAQSQVGVIVTNKTQPPTPKIFSTVGNNSMLRQPGIQATRGKCRLQVRVGRAGSRGMGWGRGSGSIRESDSGRCCQTPQAAERSHSSSLWDARKECFPVSIPAEFTAAEGGGECSFALHRKGLWKPGLWASPLSTEEPPALGAGSPPPQGLCICPSFT